MQTAGKPSYYDPEGETIYLSSPAASEAGAPKRARRAAHVHRLRVCTSFHQKLHTFEAALVDGCNERRGAVGLPAQCSAMRA